jgi:thimet oligopeptidase
MKYIERSEMNLTEFKNLVESDFESFDSIKKIFPKNSEDVKKYSGYSKDLLNQDIDGIIAISKSGRNFDNTAKALDNAQRKFRIASNILNLLEMASPDEPIRNACHEQIIDQSAFYVDKVSCNKSLFSSFNDYVQGNAKQEKLDAEQQYYLQEVLKDFKRQGLHLPDDLLEKVKGYEKAVAKLGLDFETNVAKDKSHILADESNLEGLSKDFIQCLEKNDQGKYVIKCDYPTYFEICEHCKCEGTRRDLYRIFNNRAWPVNIECLHGVILNRDKLARKVGFKNYAEMDLDAEMVKSLQTAETFIDELVKRSKSKALSEVQNFLKDLPEGVVSDSDNKMQPWNYSYIKAFHKKKHFSIDEREIAKYFPVDKTLDAIFQIYQNFLNLKFDVSTPAWAWHEDVLLIKVSDLDSGVLRGYLFLDLYPRENKYSHACCAPLIPTQLKSDGKIVPAVTAIIANFPKARKDAPALLKFNDVHTFFHEFGHAMHDILGATQMANFAGLSVKHDFVEVPSQMFEEWIYDKDTLKKLSSHYQTGQPLPDELIAKLIALKKIDAGHFLVRQCVLSLIALEMFKDGKIKDSDAIVKSLYEKHLDYMLHDDQTHFQASFGHLIGYGAKYYSYMWSKVFALDLFYEIKKRGLNNPLVGKELVSKVLCKGGSVDPELLLQDFLGRQPSQDAFLHDMGII